MELETVIKNRRSIRHYNEKEIEKIEPSNFAITNTHLEVMHCTKCNSEYKKDT